MIVILEIFTAGVLLAIIHLLNEILGELRLAKRDREDEQSQRTSDE